MFLSTGKLQYDPGYGSKNFQQNWLILLCDNDISRYYCWLLKSYGIESYSNNNSLYKTHISIVKGENLLNNEKWKKYNEFEVDFYYTNQIRFDNGRHAWVDVYSEDFGHIREELGLDFKYRYHLTIGSLKRPFNDLNISNNNF